jgi:hypothetical protein
MSSGERKIKSFKDFSMIKPSYYNMLNRLVVVGEFKPGIFSRKRKFSLTVYYTPMKGKIMDIISDESNLDLPFNKGDNISVVREWVVSNNYEITIDKKKI